MSACDRISSEDSAICTVTGVFLKDGSVMSNRESVTAFSDEIVKEVSNA